MDRLKAAAEKRGDPLNDTQALTKKIRLHVLDKRVAQGQSKDAAVTDVEAYLQTDAFRRFLATRKVTLARARARIRNGSL